MTKWQQKKTCQHFKENIAKWNTVLSIDSVSFWMYMCLALQLALSSSLSCCWFIFTVPVQDTGRCCCSFKLAPNGFHLGTLSHCSPNAIDHIVLAIVFPLSCLFFQFSTMITSSGVIVVFLITGMSMTASGESAVWSLGRQSLDIYRWHCLCLRLHVITLMQFHVFLSSCPLVIYSFLLLLGAIPQCTSWHRRHLQSTVWARDDVPSGHAMSFCFSSPSAWINLSNALPVLSCIIYLLVPCRYLSVLVSCATSHCHRILSTTTLSLFFWYFLRSFLYFLIKQSHRQSY